MAARLERDVKCSTDLHRRRQHVFQYVCNHQLEDFFDFLLAQVISKRPSEPLQFLVDLLDECMLFRGGHTSPPTLFSQNHVNQIFKSLDSTEAGEIPLCKYETAMKAMGVKQYNRSPLLTGGGNVSKDIFYMECRKSLTITLSDIVTIHK